MSARVQAGPRLGGLSLEGLSLEELSPGGPLLGGPPVSVPAGFGVVPVRPSAQADQTGVVSRPKKDPLGKT